ESWIDLANKQMTAEERTEVYSDAWFMRIEESLAEDFPKFRETVDDEEWDQLVRSYLKAHPSSSYTLARTGDKLPAFLSQKPEIESWQADLALLEKAIYKSSGAANIAVWDVAELERMNPDDVETLKFVIQPAVSLISSDWNIFELQEDSEAPPTRSATAVLVYREGFNVKTRKLEAEEFQFLKKIEDGATLVELIESFPENAWLPWLVSAAASGVIQPVLDSRS
ncbi:MAG: DUF2063 domain-containing protein, partial [Proteobacteria bacterium]